MDLSVTNKIYRQILMLDEFDGASDIHHKILSHHSFYRYLLVGPHKSGRTSLLFELAFQAAEKHNHVLFITFEPFTTLPHFHSRRVTPSTEVLNRIHLVYPSDLQKCLALLAELHTRKTFYSLIILDNLEEYIVQEKSKVSQCTTMLMAQLIDVTAYCSSQCGTNSTLICSMCNDSPIYRNSIDVIELWIQNEIRFQLPRSQNKGSSASDRASDGFLIKSKTKIEWLSEKSDSGMVGIQARFNDGRITLK